MIQIDSVFSFSEHELWAYKRGFILNAIETGVLSLN